MQNHTSPKNSELGKETQYDTIYNPDKLFPIARKTKRDEIGVTGKLPFFGFDVWNHYEVSWLNDNGKPIVALAEIIYGCDSTNIIESKSMKLYFNSFNNTRFTDATALQKTIHHDLEQRLGASFISVRITPLAHLQDETLAVRLKGFCIDDQDVVCASYHTDQSLLTTEPELVQETLCSDLLKSNCLITNQPDWCSIQITYKGNKINQAGLLRYLVSFRNDNEFHEQCIEKIFLHILERCHPQELTIYGRSTRRGGIDINSIRSTQAFDAKTIVNTRLCRQ